MLKGHLAFTPSTMLSLRPRTSRSHPLPRKHCACLHNDNHPASLRDDGRGEFSRRKMGDSLRREDQNEPRHLWSHGNDTFTTAIKGCIESFPELRVRTQWLSVGS